MKKRVKALLFQAPAIILLIISFLGSLFVKMFGLAGLEEQIGWGSPILLGVILVAYFWGRKLERSNNPY